MFTSKKLYNEDMKTDYLERQSYPTDLTDDQWAQTADDSPVIHFDKKNIAKVVTNFIGYESDLHV